MLMSMLIVSHQDSFLVVAQIRGNTESRYYLNSINYNQEMGKMKKNIFKFQTTQYVCGDEMGGPIGCLQYFTAVTGTVASFNYPLGTTAIGANPTSK